MDIAVVVVAFFAGCETIAVRIGKAHAAVAVVVIGVGAVIFCGAGMKPGVGIVAVGVQLRCATGLITPADLAIHGAKSIAIFIGVPGSSIHRVWRVHFPITVVVNAVAFLIGAWVDLGVCVVAVFPRGEPIPVPVRAQARVVGDDAGLHSADVEAVISGWTACKQGEQEKNGSAGGDHRTHLVSGIGLCALIPASLPRPGSVASQDEVVRCGHPRGRELHSGQRQTGSCLGGSGLFGPVSLR